MGDVKHLPGQSHIHQRDCNRRRRKPNKIYELILLKNSMIIHINFSPCKMKSFDCTNNEKTINLFITEDNKYKRSGFANPTKGRKTLRRCLRLRSTIGKRVWLSNGEADG